MEAEVVWLDQALKDINEILTYISRDSPKAADAYIDSLVESTQRLARFPESGRRYDANFRAISFRSHRIFYRFDANRRIVSVTAVVDSRRDVEAALERR